MGSSTYPRDRSKGSRIKIRLSDGLRISEIVRDFIEINSARLSTEKASIALTSRKFCCCLYPKNTFLSTLIHIKSFLCEENDEKNVRVAWESDLDKNRRKWLPARGARFARSRRGTPYRRDALFFLLRRNWERNVGKSNKMLTLNGKQCFCVLLMKLFILFWVEREGKSIFSRHDKG